MRERGPEPLRAWGREFCEAFSTNKNGGAYAPPFFYGWEDSRCSLAA